MPWSLCGPLPWRRRWGGRPPSLSESLLSTILTRRFRPECWLGEGVRGPKAAATPLGGWILRGATSMKVCQVACRGQNNRENVFTTWGRCIRSTSSRCPPSTGLSWRITLVCSMVRRRGSNDTRNAPLTLISRHCAGKYNTGPGKMYS
jgi:hypothetical protein